MSDRTYIENRLKDLRSLHAACLANESSHLRKEAEYRRSRDSAPDPTRTNEHQQEMDKGANAERNSAEGQRREARRVATEISGLESHLRSLR